MTTQPADGWVEWKGGECPVGPNDHIEIRCRDGSTEISSHPQLHFDWRQGPVYFYDADIIAYRLLAPSERG